VPGLPWSENRLLVTPPALARDESVAGQLAAFLGLSASDTSDVRLVVDPGDTPLPVISGYRLRRATHLVLGCGQGAVVRLGRLDDQSVRSVTEALGTRPVRAALRQALDQAASLARLGGEVLDLAGAWRFATDPRAAGEAAGWADPAFDDSAWESLPVPSPWEAAGHKDYDGIAWYRRRIEVPPAWRGTTWSSRSTPPTTRT